MKQQYSNHIRFYYPHHFVFYPAVLVLTGITVRQAYVQPERRLEWIFITILILLAGWLSFMMRQHYALTLQNRIVRLELRLRYFQLTGQPFEPLEEKLSFGQLAALRFAPDDELEGLIRRALDERLPPDRIKQAIVRWRPDDQRV